MLKVSKVHCLDFNALNAMYIKDVKDNKSFIYLFIVRDIEDVYNVYELQCRF